MYADDAINESTVFEAVAEFFATQAVGRLGPPVLAQVDALRTLGADPDDVIDYLAICLEAAVSEATRLTLAAVMAQGYPGELRTGARAALAEAWPEHLATVLARDEHR